MKATLVRAISKDGTPIACLRSGSGPPLVLVAGTGAANPMAWSAVVPSLQERFTVYAIDRRGHGDSGDSPDYALEREFEDIAAVVDSMDEPADVLGHSFGATIALEASLLTGNMRRLALYEPAIPIPGVPVFAEGYVERLQAHLDAGDLEGMLMTVYSEELQLPPEQIAQLKASAGWPSRLDAARTLPREARAGELYTFDGPQFRDMQTPTLLLLGSESLPMFHTATEMVGAALPNSRVAVLQRQQHMAIYTAPDVFAETVLGFFAE